LSGCSISKDCFEPGTRLNHYRLLAPIGAGGMGEVYEADDTRLKRRVALKSRRSIIRTS
jgi:serine/threonine protein kinase